MYSRDYSVPEGRGKPKAGSTPSQVLGEDIYSQQMPTTSPSTMSGASGPTKPKTIQSLVEYLKGCLGVTKIPLAYVIRDEPGIFPDPPGGHITQLQELIARAPILAVGSDSLSNPFTQTYLDDRSKVWELLLALTRDLECWSYVMLAQKTRDGRSAFFNLKLALPGCLEFREIRPCTH